VERKGDGATGEPEGDDLRRVRAVAATSSQEDLKGAALTRVARTLLNRRLRQRRYVESKSQSTLDESSQLDHGQPRDDQSIDRRAESDAIARKGEKWVALLAPDWQQLPTGTRFIINIETGHYVSAASGVEAIRLFEQRFGQDAVGWSFDVGRPLTVGSGANFWRR
jgi:hypothetical protein